MKDPVLLSLETREVFSLRMNTTTTLDGKKKLKMPQFKNVNNPILLYKEEDPETLLEELVPGDEKHLQ